MNLEQHAKSLVAHRFRDEYGVPLRDLMLFDNVWAMKEYAEMYGKKSKVSIFNKDCQSCGAPLEKDGCHFCGRPK